MSSLPAWAQITIGGFGAVVIAVMLIAIFGERTEDEKADFRDHE